MMDDLVRAGADATGLDEGRVRLALAGALGLLRKHAAQDRLDALYAAVPGSQDLAYSPQADIPRAGGLFGGVMRSAGGVSGAAVSDAMGMLAKAEKAGVSKADLKVLLKAVEARVKDQTGRDVLREAVASVPGVGRLIGG